MGGVRRTDSQGAGGFVFGAQNELGLERNENENESRFGNVRREGRKVRDSKTRLRSKRRCHETRRPVRVRAGDPENRQRRCAVRVEVVNYF